MSGRIIRKDVAGNPILAGGNTLPEAGKIKIGDTVPGKTKDGKDYNRPVGLDYFRATGDYVEMFNKTYGHQPRKLLIVFISDNIDEVCNQRFECWDKGKRWGWGDGEDFTVFDEKAGPIKNNKPEGAYVQVKKGSPLLSGRKWDEMLTLRFILPEMKGLLAQWTFTTKGAKAIIPSIVKGFDFIKERVGRVSGIPWEFHVEKIKGYSPGEARQYSKVKLVPVITAGTVEKMHDFLESGGSLAKIAPIMLNEAKLEGVKRIDAPAILMTTTEDQAQDFTPSEEIVTPPIVESDTPTATEDVDVQDKSIKPGTNKKFNVDKDGRVTPRTEQTDLGL